MEKESTKGEPALDRGQEKLNRWPPYLQHQGAQERVLRTLNLTEALSILLLFVFPPAAFYGFIPISGLLWIVLLFGGEQFSKEVERYFPEDTDVKSYTKDADARTQNPLRWNEFFTSPSGRLFFFALVQAAVIVLLWYYR